VVGRVRWNSSEVLVGFVRLALTFPPELWMAFWPPTAARVPDGAVVAVREREVRVPRRDGDGWEYTSVVVQDCVEEVRKPAWRRDVASAGAKSDCGRVSAVGLVRRWWRSVSGGRGQS
jgi:hypothetical protein